MKENTTVFKIEIEVAAQKVIHQFMTNNAEIEEQLREAIEEAVKSFDFKSEVVRITQSQLKSAIQDAMSYGSLEKLVRDKAQGIFNEILEREFSKYK